MCGWMKSRLMDRKSDDRPLWHLGWDGSDGLQVVEPSAGHINQLIWTGGSPLLAWLAPTVIL